MSFAVKSLGSRISDLVLAHTSCSYTSPFSSLGFSADHISRHDARLGRTDFGLVRRQLRDEHERDG